MKHFSSLSRIAFMTLIAIGLSGCIRLSTGDPASEIDRANQEFMDAFAAGNASRIGDLYTMDARLYPPNADVVKGRPAIADYWRAGMAPGARLKLETLELEGRGPKAYEIGQYTILAADGSTVAQGDYTVFWKREKDVWRLHRDLWN